MPPEPQNVLTFYADTFKDRRVVDAYRHRPPYPDEVFAILASLLTDEPRAVLDVGAGSDDLARDWSRSPGGSMPSISRSP